MNLLRDPGLAGSDVAQVRTIEMGGPDMAPPTPPASELAPLPLAAPSWMALVGGGWGEAPRRSPIRITLTWANDAICRRKSAGA